MKSVPEGVPFGDFELIRRLGVGGMAEVFLVKRRGPEGFQKRLVIKRLLPHLNRSQTYIELFLKEAQMAALVDHPNLAHVSDFGQVEGRHYLAMEYVDGITVSDFLEKAQLTRPGVAARVAMDVLAGLQALHTARGIDGERLNLVHRDITPRNVMLTRGGNVKLLDLGIAVQAKETDQQQAGTKNHMSPEQAQGLPVDRRADIYSVGLLVVRMLCGRLELSHTEGRPERPEQLPKPLWPLLEKALRYAPEARYATAKEFQRALERFAVDQGEESSKSYLAELVDSVLPSLTEAMRLDMEQVSPKQKAPVTETAAPEAPPEPLDKAEDLETQDKLRMLVEEDAPPSDAQHIEALLHNEGPTVESPPNDTRVEVVLMPRARPSTNAPIPRISSETDAAPTRAMIGRLPQLTDTRKVTTELVEPPKRSKMWLWLAGLLGLLGIAAALLPSKPKATAAAPPPAVPKPPEPPAPKVEQPKPQLVRTRPAKARPSRSHKPRRIRKRRAVRPAKPVAPGFLSINTQPWTRVFVDGQRLDVTPIERATLPAGKHKLRLVNPEKGIEKKFNIKIAPGKVTRVFRSYE